MLVNNDLDTDLLDIERVRLHGWHITTNRKRARILAARGEFIKWSMYYHAWIWDFQNRKGMAS